MVYKWLKLIDPEKYLKTTPENTHCAYCFSKPIENRLLGFRIFEINCSDGFKATITKSYVLSFIARASLNIFLISALSRKILETLTIVQYSYNANLDATLLGANIINTYILFCSTANAFWRL